MMPDDQANTSKTGPANQPAPPTLPPVLRRDLLPPPVLAAISLYRDFVPLPGLAAISLYMVVLAIVDVVSVVGGQFRPIYIVLAAFFFAAAGGLLMLLRWAWALTLAAVVLLAGLFLLKFYTDRQLPFIVQGLMNLVFFLYLVRPEVREKLR